MISAPPGWTRRGLGWKKPRPRDVSHRLLAARLEARKSALPPAKPAADIKPLVLSVLDQGQLGSCTLNAILQLIRTVRVLMGETNPELAARLAGYIMVLLFEGQLADNGADPLDVFQVLKTFGFCRESRFPYNIATFNAMVEAAKTDPAQGRLPLDIERFMWDQRDKTGLDYARVTGATDGDKIDQIKRLISAGHGVTWGGPVTNAFCEGQTDPNVPMQYPTSDVAGGHEVICGGYDPISPWMLNSWGPDFGVSGWFRMSWECLLSDQETETVLEAPGFSDPPLMEAA